MISLKIQQAVVVLTSIIPPITGLIMLYMRSQVGLDITAYLFAPTAVALVNVFLAYILAPEAGKHYTNIWRLFAATVLGIYVVLIYYLWLPMPTMVHAGFYGLLCATPAVIAAYFLWTLTEDIRLAK